MKVLRISGFQSIFMISIFFHDLANTIKTLPISAGLNSQASNGLDPHMNRTLENTCQINTKKHTVCSLYPPTDMVYLGEQKNDNLLRCIKRGVIDPHNLDRAYLYGKTVQLFKGFEGDKTPKLRANFISQHCKKLRN
jgi:hypothetical protein